MKDKLIEFSKRLGNEKFVAFGMIAQRIDEEKYFVNGEEAYLSDIDDFLIKSDGLIGEIFKSRKDINSIILLKNDEMGKITRRVYPSLDDLAQIIGTSVRISDDSSPSNILGALKKRYGCYILGYGGLALGRDLEEALAAIRILQKSAHVELCGNNIKYLSYIDCLLMNYVYKHKYSKANSDTLELPDYPANEKEIRNEIVECGKTLVNEGIVQGTWGNISVRISPTEMLITPSGMDYYSVSDKDIVKLDLKTMEYGDQRKPSGEKKLHQMIYLLRPEINAVIHTHSYNLAINTANREEYKVEGNLKTLILGDIPVSDYALPGTNKLTKAVEKKISNRNACIIANHGVVCCKESLEDTLKICRMLESDI